MTICNVGSRKLEIEDDYASKGWGIFSPRLTIYGFDADADACNQANADLELRQVTWAEKHIPLILGKSVGESTLYVTKHPACTSLYPPNETYLERFVGMVEPMTLDFTVDLEITTLDSFCELEGINEIDFLQTDVQGGDLHVLEGASRVLESSILAVQVEVLFSNLYINQPMFADIDTYLRNQGFTLFDLAPAYRSRACSPLAYTPHPRQLLWGDAFYFRDLILESNNQAFRTPERIFKLACIADVMNFHDYALELLEYLTIHYGTDENYNFANNIIESLAQFPELMQHGLGNLPVVAKIRNYLTTSSINLLQSS